MYLMSKNKFQQWNQYYDLTAVVSTIFSVILPGAMKDYFNNSIVETKSKKIF